jgi:hypothetical protein
MPSIASIASLAGLASLAFATPVDIQKRNKGAFSIDQVKGSTVKKAGPVAYQRALQKFSKPVPSNVAAAAAAVTGTVTATPESDDAEYLCPVNVGGTLMNLDFDTGSADLYVT